MIISPNLILDLQYWFNNFLFTSKLNKNQIPYPSELSDNYFSNDNSFIRLLFDDNWPTNFTSYIYMFYEQSLSSNTPDDISKRLCLYPNPKIYKSSSTGTLNLFNLGDDDLYMLNQLLDYRTGNIISIDSTSEYASDLSILIHSYLDLVINLNINEQFNTVNLICNNLLTCLYEIYVTDKIFEFISDMGS